MVETKVIAAVCQQMSKARHVSASNGLTALPTAAIVWWTNAAGDFVEKQPFWAAYTGQTWDQYKGSGWVSCLHPDDVQTITADWQSAVSSGAPYFTQGRIWSAKHKAYRAFQTRGIPIKDEDGNIVEWLGALTDIQDSIDIRQSLDRTQADLIETLKALRLSEARSLAHLAEVKAIEAKLAKEAAALSRLNEASSQLWQSRDLTEGLNETLKASIALLGADKGNVQLLDGERDVLLIATQVGFDQPFLEVFKEVSISDDTACGRALRFGERIIIADITADTDYAAYLSVALAAGYRAVQSTPLIGRDGTPLGMLSTHFARAPHRPSPQELNLLDLYARQAADFIERHRIYETLRLSRLAIFNTVADGIITIDRNGTVETLNPAAARLFGYAPEEVIGRNVKMLMPELYRREHDKSLVNYLETGQAKMVGSSAREVKGQRKDGSIFPIELTVGEVDVAGRRMFTGVVRDITERKRTEEHQALLVAELDHRVKNILAQVAVVASSARQGSRSIDEFLRSLDGRIQSMAGAHSLLSESSWHCVGLKDLIHSQLAPYTTDTNVKISGTDLMLTSAETQTLAKVLHELATNAAKYGALSIPGGQVSVTWDRKPNGQAATLILQWRELGGPPVASKVQSSYGTDLIRDLIPHELGGTVDLVFAAEGANCRIEFPIRQPST
jgi:PAS domain S-box-containing protein